MIFCCAIYLVLQEKLKKRTWLSSHFLDLHRVNLCMSLASFASVRGKIYVSCEKELFSFLIGWKDNSESLWQREVHSSFSAARHWTLFAKHIFVRQWVSKHDCLCAFKFIKKETTFDNGSLGSRNDEERSELRYVVWIAEIRESSNLWTHLALLGTPRSMPVWESWTHLCF